MSPRLTKLLEAAGAGAGRAVRAARFLPSAAAGVCLVVAGAMVHPALGWAVAGVALLAMDRRFT